ncbi:MAG: 5'/3'-nucleotidase SurE [Acidibacillus sp.]|uniref:5'-nucleotidase SurE n=1 Tax=Sulfoacidibacillus ferrooxidans TaxID=2005001 RepID=A0A9X1V9R5_9BACL|nr:5'/3'-nucleotidase SurE [Sulfoacidibacillus ferrooxidans]MCI0184266.1 5'-nucleotidase SurE [Sulfoacidibacillus ferrooxidans]MCY0894524.1 5'/3'-nucleotidase SurE [Acidibacillus sp.]
MRVLITNDDGIHASGIQSLAKHFSSFSTVTVVAPDRQQSATSHSITLHKPLHVDEVRMGANIRAFQVNGTPADCVKLALGALCNEPPDLVLSGVNSGANLGLDIVYSGTASAAGEAVLQGYPAIALSVTKPPFDYTASVQIATILAHKLMQHGVPSDTYLNVNVPPLPYEELQGIVITRIGVRKYKNAYEQRIDPLGRTYYWQAGQIVKVHNEPDTDVHAIEAGKVSVTPVHFDFTNGQSLVTLNSWQLTL